MTILLLLALETVAQRWGLADAKPEFFERVARLADHGASTEAARAYLDVFAKKPEPAVLRGLGWLLEREASTPEQRRRAHVLLLVLTGRDVRTPDPDLWRSILGTKDREYVRPSHPSAGEVRAAILTGAAWLYRQLDEHGLLRSTVDQGERREFGPVSVGDTSAALLALHRSGLPKRDASLQLWLARARKMHGSKLLARARKEWIWWKNHWHNRYSDRDLVSLSWGGRRARRRPRSPARKNGSTNS